MKNVNYGSFTDFDTARTLRCGVSECVGLMYHKTHNRSFGDESLQAINCTGTDNQTTKKQNPTYI